MKVELLYPLGFCKGVQSAIDMAIKAANDYKDLPIYCINPIVHNQIINDELKEKGIKVLKGDKKELIDSINSGVVIFSAHGTDQKLIEYAKSKNLIVINTICAYVEKSMDIIRKYLLEGYDIIFIGVKKHPETEAICSISDRINLCTDSSDIPFNIHNDKIAVVNQTTLSIDDLSDLHRTIHEHYPSAVFADEICNSTRMRQNKIKNVPSDCDGLIIVGDQSSNNTKTLLSLAKKQNVDAIMITDLSKLDESWLKDKHTIYIGSGASTPMKVIKEIYNYLKK